MTRAERAAQIWQVLVGAARLRQILTYEILADLIGMGREGTGAGTLAQSLGIVMRYCDSRGLPPLTVLVVNKATGQPGRGLTTVQELHSDRERVFNHAWLGMAPPQVADLARDDSRGPVRKPSGGRGKRKWTVDEALAEFDETSADLGELARGFIAWTDGIAGSGYYPATRQAEIKPAIRVGKRLVPLIALTVEKRVHIAFQAWANVPVLGEETVRKRLLQELNLLLGTNLRGTTSWPSFDAALLRDPNERRAFLDILDALVKRVRAAGA